MRGSPLRQLLAVALLILISGVLVFSLTRSREVAATFAPPAASSAPVKLRITFTTTSPCEVSLSNAGSAILPTTLVADSFETDFTAAAGKIQDTALKGRWSSQAPRQALRVTITWDGETIADQTFWGQSSVEDILTFTAPNP